VISGPAASDATSKWQVQLRKGCIELGTLASLFPGRLYGLEMLRRLGHCAGMIVAEGTIYPLGSGTTASTKRLPRQALTAL
jgi:hypothetical protein